MRSYVAVKFEQGGSLYTYLAEGSVEELDQFSHAVVLSPRNNDYVVTKVAGVTVLDESTYNGTYKYIVAMFDDQPYKDRLAKVARKAALEKELHKRIAEQSVVKQFETLLGDDVQSKALLEEYKSL